MFKNSKVQGDAGLGKAISYFTQQGLTVAIPLTDSQDYDLIVEIDGTLQRIQVKTGTMLAKNKKQTPLIFTVVNGGNKTGSTAKYVPEQNWDYLFCWHITVNETYLIPKENITAKSQLNLSDRYKDFLID